MRVVLHRVADDVGHLDEASVVLLVEGVEDAPLDGLEAVLDGGDGAVADGVGCELQEVLVHELAQGAAAAVGDGGGLALGGGEGAALGLLRHGAVGVFAAGLRLARLLGFHGRKQGHVVEQARRLVGGIRMLPFSG
jgi:hypothetical protein